MITRLHNSHHLPLCCCADSLLTHDEGMCVFKKLSTTITYQATYWSRKTVYSWLAPLTAHLTCTIWQQIFTFCVESHAVSAHCRSWQA
jgi:hypothetical protein